LKTLKRSGLLVGFDGIRRCNSTREEFPMNNKLVRCLIAGALSATLALASPAFARGGGGGGGGGHGGGGGGFGGGHGFGGGGHGFGGGGMRGGGMGGGMHASAMHFSGMGGGMHFSGARFAHHEFSHRSSRFAFRDRDGFGRHHHRFHRFAFFGAPYDYASYDSCYRRVWTPYGLQWSNACGDYGY
jgi:hypothetical protein